MPARKTSAVTRKPASTEAKPLNADELKHIHAWWRACNYLSVGMIYLRDNPLLKEPLKIEHVKHRLLGHWGASPALSFVWAHLNRVIKRDDLDVIFMAGPGHGAPGVLGPAYLEGTYSEIYPDKSEDAEVLNETDRFKLVIDVIDRVPGLAARAAHLKERMKNEIILNLAYAHEHGTDRAEITNWVWPF